MKWSIIIFCYNEQSTIQEVVQSALNFINIPQHQGSEIIIVDDGSNDDTSHICQSLVQQEENIKLIVHEKNCGIGAALKSGYLVAQKDFICSVPGDGQFNIQELEQIETFDSNKFVSFYRTVKNYSLYRSCLTWINNKFNAHLLGIKLRDVNWIKIYPREKLQHINFELNSSLIESEIVAKLILSGCRPIEYHSEYLPRKGGVSRGGSIKTLTKAIKEIKLLYTVVRKYKKVIRQL